jgi:hypothetical protein
MVNYEEALKKPFTDLTKLVIGIVLSIIPVVNWIARGYALECSGVGKYKPSKNMPDWKDFVDYLIKGFVSYVIGIVYMIPALIVVMVVAAFALSSILASFLGVSPDTISSIMSGSASNEQIASMAQQGMLMALPALITAAPAILLAVLLALIASYLIPIATMNYLKNKSFSKAFDLSFIISKALTTRYLIVWILASVIAGLITAFLGFIPFIGYAVGFFISEVVIWSLYGQIFREK